MRQVFQALIPVLLLTCAAPIAVAADATFFSDERLSGFRLSPDGNQLAFVVDVEGGEEVRSIDLQTGAEAVLFATPLVGSENVTISAISWIDATHILANVYALTEGVARLSDTRNRHHKLILNTADRSVRFIQTSGRVISTLPLEPDKLLMSVMASTSYVYKIDVTKLTVWGQKLKKTAKVDGGQFSRANRIAEIDGFAFNWLADGNGSIRAVMHWSQDEGVQLSTRDDMSSIWEVQASWREKNNRKKRSRQALIAADLEATEYRLLSLVPNSSDFLVLSKGEGGRQALLQLSLANGTTETIYEHPQAEILGVNFHRTSGQLLSAHYFDSGYIGQHYFQEGPSQVAQLAAAEYPRHRTLVVGMDNEQQRYAVLVYANNDPGKLIVYDLPNRLALHTQSLAPALDGLKLAPSTSGKVDVEGTPVEYFLTRHESADPMPLIVYPHGGPFGVVDDRQYDPAVQYLAAHDFAVLQINYRGSGGYGSEFLEAGKGEYGDMMLADIEAAVSAAITGGGIDAERMCLLGDSYGGYAAIMLALRNPERFRCAATFAGVYDLGLFLGRLEDASRKAVVELFIGDTEEATLRENYDRLKALSPLYQLESLAIPVMITHGNDDRQVDIEHALRMETRIKQLEKPFTVQYYPDIGHGFDSPETYFHHMRAVTNFITEHTAN